MYRTNCVKLVSASKNSPKSNIELNILLSENKVQKRLKMLLDCVVLITFGHDYIIFGFDLTFGRVYCVERDEEEAAT